MTSTNNSDDEHEQGTMATFGFDMGSMFKGMMPEIKMPKFQASVDDMKTFTEFSSTRTMTTSNVSKTEKPPTTAEHLPSCNQGPYPAPAPGPYPSFPITASSGGYPGPTAGPFQTPGPYPSSPNTAPSEGYPGPQPGPYHAPGPYPSPSPGTYQAPGPYPAPNSGTYSTPGSYPAPTPGPYPAQTHCQAQVPGSYQAPGPYSTAPAASYPVPGGYNSPSYNLPVPYVLKIAGGLAEGKVLSISGIPKSGATRFNVNLFRGTDIAYHIDVRFNYGRDKNVVLTNCQKDGSWGIEKRQKLHFPFGYNKKFDMAIKVKWDCYKIFVDGKELLWTMHKVKPLSHIDTLKIEGDVDLTDVRVQ